MENEFVEVLKDFETGVITDTLSLLGFGGWMTDILPVNPDHRVCGRAFTMRFTTESDPNVKSYAYYELLDHVKPGDVIVIAADNCPLGLIGENIQNATRRCQCAGIVLDGRNRDNAIVRQIQLPVFSRGRAIRMVPKEFKLTSYQVPVMCAGAVVYPGDYIIGDMDGVIAIPQARIKEVLYQAEYVATVETEMEQAIKNGKSMKDCLAVIGKKKNIRT